MFVDTGSSMGDQMGDTMGPAPSGPTPTPPTITTLSPAFVIVDGAALLLTITGTGYDGSTTVTFGSNSSSVSLESSTVLYAIVKPEWLTAAGTITVTVANNSGSATAPFTVEEFILTGPLTCTTTPSPIVIRAGDSLPTFPAILSDANGPVDVSKATLRLFLTPIWSDESIAGGTVTAGVTQGHVTIVLPTLTLDGIYYGYITDGRGASYPDNGPGFLVAAAAS